MVHVLLVGGGGFIGRNIARSCLDAGMRVRVSDVHRPTVHPCPSDGLPEDVEVTLGNYLDAAYLREALRDIDVVVHLAHDAMRMNIDCDMPREYERNILPSTRLMEACIAAKVKKFIFISSGGTVYGNQPSSTPIVESAPMHPVSLYGTSKLCIEHIANLYSVQRALPAIIVRPANAYGPGQLPFRGQGLVPTALASGMSGKRVTIFGNGRAVRDYVHVKDIAHAIVAIAVQGRPGETYNVGTGIGVSVRELLQEYMVPILDRAGCTLEVSYEIPRRADVEYNVLDSSHLTQATGWRPHIGLREGIAQVFEWLKTKTREI